jgi:translation initiation factor 3 subunit C
MDANKARALNTVKHKVKKTIKEYEVQMKEYSADPEAFTAQYAASTQPEVLPKSKKTKKDRGDGEDGEVDAFTTVGKGGKTYSLGAADLYKNLAAIQEARGKKVTTFIT